MTDRYPRTLVLANNSFSRSNSNGRTLGNLFKGWPKDSLAQFAIMCIDPDFEVCDNYYQVSDIDVIHSVLKGEKAVTGTSVKAGATEASQRYTAGGGGRTAFKTLARNFLWNLGRWRGQRFAEWIDAFDPEVIVLQSGDATFMHRLAQRLTRERNIPLVIYNTEGYVFFDHNYMRHHWSDGVAFPWFKRQYRRAFRRSMAMAAHSVYLNDKLLADHEAYMPHAGSVIYNSSSLEFRPKAAVNVPPKISYLGNLGIRRPEALAEVAAVLQSVSPEYHIDVYGNAGEAAREILDAAPGIEYHGAVPYDEVVSTIYASDIILHVEKNDPVLCRELRYAFSTKIADSVCSGTDFVIYAPDNLACSQYARTTGAAWQASTTEALREVFEKILSNSPERTGVLDKARRAAAENHHLQHNAAVMKAILNEVVTKS